MPKIEKGENHIPDVGEKVLDVHNSPDNSDKPMSGAQGSDKEIAVMELVKQLNILTAREYSANNAQGLGRITSVLETTLSQASDTLQSQATEIARLQEEVERLLDYPIPTSLSVISIRQIDKVSKMTKGLKGGAS